MLALITRSHASRARFTTHFYDLPDVLWRHILLGSLHVLCIKRSQIVMMNRAKSRA